MNVLVATDLSSEADEAIRSGWATATGGGLDVCHVVPDPIAFYTPLLDLQHGVAPTPAVVREEVDRALKDRVRAVTGCDPGAVSTHVLVGNPYSEILDLAARLEIDRIVVANRGAGAAERLLLGSVSERIVRNAQCSVLVARPDVGEGPVVVATDLSEAAPATIAAGAAEAERSQCELLVVHVVDLLPPAAASALGTVGAIPVVPDEKTTTAICEAARQTLHSLTEGLSVTARRRVEIGRPGRTIVELTEEAEGRLLVIGARGRTLLRRVTLGSVAERVIRDAPCSVLAVR